MFIVISAMRSLWQTDGPPNQYMTTLLQRLRRYLRYPATILSVASLSASPTPEALNHDSAEPTVATTIPAYQPRFGRQRPVIAIIGENSGTELTDFVIPYGVLSRSRVAEVITVSTQPGILRMRPALKVQPDATIAEFDARFPEGADYVIVPAVVKFRDPTLLAWVRAQGAKGSTLMSICDGAAVVAGTGLMDGHRATAHWASAKNRRRLFPQVNWIADIRYVSDGNIVSTAGISAALPASLGLVEAIAGRERAQALAEELGVPDWSTAHQTAPFRPHFGVNIKAFLAVTYTNGWFHPTQMIGLRIADSVDEIALAVMADAYSRTGRSMLHALANSSAPVRTRSGLVVIPDAISETHHMDLELQALDATPSGLWMAKSINGISRLYGRNTAYGVALNFEFPMIPKTAPLEACQIAQK